MTKSKKPQLYPDSDGSKWIAWMPHLGLFDIRWAADYSPEPDRKPRFDTDLDVQLDLDQQYYFA